MNNNEGDAFNDTYKKKRFLIIIMTVIEVMATIIVTANVHMNMDMILWARGK